MKSLGKLSLLALLFAAAAALGCRMCQDCFDYTGPVPASPNFHNYSTSPRVGSVNEGTPIEVTSGEYPVGESYVVPGPTVEETVVPGEPTRVWPGGTDPQGR